MRQSSPSTPWGRLLSAVRRMTGRRVVETVPTLEVAPVAATTSGKVIQAPSSRFAPIDISLPAVSESASHAPSSATMVTALPAFAKPVVPRRPQRPPGISAVASGPGIEETTAPSTSPRQASRARSLATSHQAGPVKVTVGDYSAVTENTASMSRERVARESYALKSRELERAADERLAYEQQLVERRIRKQLDARQRELDSSLDEILEDTVIVSRSIDIAEEG